MSVYLYNKEPKGIRLDFEIALHEVGESPKRGEFYYDTGSGFKGTQFVTVDYHTPADGTFSRYSLILPASSIERLRFDPLVSAGKLTIKNVVVTKFTPVFLDFSSNGKDVIPLHSIEKLEKNGRELTITTNGEDPYLLLAKNITPSFISNIGYVIPSVWRDIRDKGLDRVAAGIVSLFLLSGLITYFTCSGKPD